MNFTELKDELRQVLNQDISNQNSIQELRRSIFLTSENNQKDQELIKEKDNQILSLKNELSEIDSQKSSLETERQQFLIEKENFLLEIKKLNKKNRQDLSDLENRFITERENERKQSLDKINLLEQESKQLRELFENSNLQHENELEQLKIKASNVDLLNEKITSLESESFNLMLSIEATDKNTKEEKAVFERKIEQLSHLLDEELKKALVSEDLEANKKELESQVANLMGELKMKEDCLKELNEQLNFEKENKISILNELNSLRNSAEESIESKVVLESQLLDVKQKLDLQKEQLEKSSLLISGQNLEISNFAKDIHEKSKVIFELNEKMRITEKQIEEFGTVRSNLESARQAELNLRLDSDREIFKLKEVIAESEGKIDSLSNQLTARSNDIQRFESEIFELKRQLENIQNLGDDLDKSNSKIEFLEKDIQEKEALIDDLNSSLLKMSEEIKLSGLSDQHFTDANDEFIEKLFAQINLLNDEKSILVTERDELLNEMNLVKHKLDTFNESIDKQYFSSINLEFLNKNDTLADDSSEQNSFKNELRSRIKELVEEVDGCISLLIKKEL